MLGEEWKQAVAATNEFPRRSTFGSREWGGREGKRVESRRGEGTRTDLLRYPRPAGGRSVEEC